MKNEFQNIRELIPKIDPERKYWFVRTEGGNLYELFRSNNLIAVGYDKIKVSIKDELLGEKNPKESLKKRIIKLYPEEKRPGLVSSQICRFIFEVNKGDIIIIPSYSSEKLLFGEVQDNSLFVKDLYDIEKDKSYPFQKCRNVKWIKYLYRSELNPNLYSLFFSHQTISSGNEYASYIDNALEDFYLKGNRAHLLISVNRQEGINARSLFKLCLNLLDLTEEFLKENNFQGETESIEVKSNLNSPGDIELIEYGISVLFVLGFLVCMSGGDYEFKTKILEGKLNTPGILKRIADFLEKKERNKLLEKLINELKIHESKNLREIIIKCISKDEVGN